MRSDRERWEARYRDRAARELEPPSLLLVRHQHCIPPGPVLDIAAGAGRNTLYLARAGHPVHAIDIALPALDQISTVARAQRLPVQFVQADLDDFPLPRNHYAAIINIRFLQRTLIPSLKAAVRPGGVVIFEAFLIDQRTIGHPTNPDFLLQHGELAERFADFEILSASEGRCEDEGDPVFLARLVARRWD
ncbi:MAG: class I SAM-dependent methyltransferase [Deltaproteobacteria bacterium]|nr:class I SAM-dependent methyltransferase [Deltaproteobacteria bacterium]MBI3390036.1 class I SAM-dependent methyltransferase [Deltaproteobacteria bacterium]